MSEEGNQHSELPMGISVTNDSEVTTRSCTSSYVSFYKNKFMVLELVACLIWFFVSHGLTSAIIPLTIRDVPFQQTQNGDVILDMYFNNDLVDETVPDDVLVLTCMFLPLLICFIVAICAKSPPSDFHASACAVSFAVGTSTLLTNFVKHYDGYLRPNFYNYCGFDKDSLECEEDKLEPHRSFPSGHSSLSFCGMTFLALFFYGKVGLHRPIGKHVVGSPDPYDEGTLVKKRILSLGAGLPMAWAIFVSASRVHDNFHHPADVVGGSVLGMVCAWFAYAMWYAPIFSHVAGMPLQMVYEMRRNEVSQLSTSAIGSSYA